MLRRVVATPPYPTERSSSIRAVLPRSFPQSSCFWLYSPPHPPHNHTHSPLISSHYHRSSPGPRYPCAWPVRSSPHLDPLSPSGPLCRSTTALGRSSAGIITMSTCVFLRETTLTVVQPSCCPLVTPTSGRHPDSRLHGYRRVERTALGNISFSPRARTFFWNRTMLGTQNRPCSVLFELPETITLPLLMITSFTEILLGTLSFVV